MYIRKKDICRVLKINTCKATLHITYVYQEEIKIFYAVQRSKLGRIYHILKSSLWDRSEKNLKF